MSTSVIMIKMWNYPGNFGGNMELRWDIVHIRAVTKKVTMQNKNGNKRRVWCVSYALQLR